MDIQQLLEDLKDFYVWKQYVNDPDFINKWKKDRNKVLEGIPRPTLYT